MNIKTISTQVSAANIKSWVATGLHSFGYGKGNKDIEILMDLPDMVPIKIIEKPEVEIVRS